MKKRLLLTLFLQFLLCYSANAELRAISQYEATTIVEAEETAKERAKDEREHALRTVDTIESAVADLGERKVLFNRVQIRPVIKQAPQLEAREVQRQLTEAEIDRLRQEHEFKEPVMVMFSGEVYDGQITELRWSHDKRNYLAYCNVDFRLLAGTAGLDTEDTSYSYFMMIGEGSREAIRRQNHRALIEGWKDYTPKWIPQLSDFSVRSPEYLVISDDPQVIANESAFAPLDTLLQHYQENERELKISYQRQEALREARKRYLEENPPPVRDTVITFAPSADSASLQKK